MNEKYENRIFVKHIRDIPISFTGRVSHVLGSEHWFYQGKRHRIDGPAVISSIGVKHYFINGKPVSKETQQLLYNMMKLKGIL